MKKLIALALVFAVMGVAFAAQSEDVLNVTVIVSTKTMVDVNPAAFSYTGAEPGSANYTDDSGYTAVQIENIGSHNITHIWFNVTQPEERPFATANATKYDAGNFVVLKQEGGSAYLFVDRLDFNESKTIVYLTDPSGNIPPQSPYKYGRFRNASNEWFWFVNPDANGWCNSTSATFYLANEPKTSDSTGTTDFSSCSGSLSTAPSGSGCRSGSPTSTVDDGTQNWSYIADVALSSNEHYHVAINQWCNETRWVKWNVDAPGASDALSVADYFISNDLPPGDSVIAYTGIHVPYGTMEGTVKKGYLTVIVNDV